MKFLKISLLVFILTISSLSFVEAAFREPTSPTDTVPAPVNSLYPGQTKIGSLNLPSLSVLGDLLTGYVGIGGDANNANSIPQEKLDIQGNINIHNQIKIDGVAPLDGQVLHFDYDDITGSPKMRWGGNYAFVSFTSDVVDPNCNLDGLCGVGESCSSCPGDCVPPKGEACEVSTGMTMGSICDLDLKCESARGENKNNCPDCRGCENPGLGCNNNGICEDNLPSDQNEGWQSCSTDCVCSFRKYNPTYVSGICGDGHVDPGEQCDPPAFGGHPAFVPPGVCGVLPKFCGPDCKWVEFSSMKWGGKETVPPNLRGGGDTTPPGGGGSCKNNNTGTGAPQCGGSCPAGESCQDNNGGAAGGLCQCISSSACGGTYPACNGPCPLPTDICRIGSVGGWAEGTCICSPTTPSSIGDLQATNITTNSVTLTWSAPSAGVTSYIIKRSFSLITQANFNSATTISNSLIPQAPGSFESFIVSGLSSNTKYYFAIESSDGINTSLISNVPSATTLASGPDTTRPATIVSLSGVNLGNNVNLSWIAPGDDGMSGTATSYDIRRSFSKITQANFISATPISNPPTPAVAGTQQSKMVSGLTNGLIYYFAMRASDEVPNISPISNSFWIEVGSGGGSNPAFNGSNYKNPFALLFDSIDLNLTPKAKAAGTCGNVWLPLSCYEPWNESSFVCVDDTWIRTCFKEQ